ncbi:phage holin family protein [Microbacterium telephonicum]|uniref:Putative superfamily III holin-X n=1 Tax=Microbacterium telephonicum TaxID=1714841 RepID=A0A498BUS3_9MICO|nr:phage holin family protein [Microbacterium telephonicum]RLK46659.1 putative superfamily III holin-X [Microbacterium telephonicum]
MSTPRGFRDRNDDSLFALLGDIPELVRNLVVAEIDAAKKWAAAAGKQIGLGSAWFAVALFLLFWLIPALGAFTIIGLASWMPAWLSSLIVVVLLLVAIAVFAFMGLRRFKKLSKSENPAQAVAADARIVKDVVDEY